MDDVTLLAEDGTAIGTLPKSEVHTHDTPCTSPSRATSSTAKDDCC